MKTFTFDAEPHHVLVYGDGQSVQGGDSFSVTDERAIELLADPSIPLKEETQELLKLTRHELEALATQHGIEDPETYPSKASLIEALNASVPDHTTTETEE